MIVYCKLALSRTLAISYCSDGVARTISPKSKWDLLLIIKHNADTKRHRHQLCRRVHFQLGDRILTLCYAERLRFVPEQFLCRSFCFSQVCCVQVTTMSQQVWPCAILLRFLEDDSNNNTDTSSLSLKQSPWYTRFMLTMLGLMLLGILGYAVKHVLQMRDFRALSTGAREITKSFEMTDAMNDTDERYYEWTSTTTNRVPPPETHVNGELESPILPIQQGVSV